MDKQREARFNRQPILLRFHSAENFLTLRRKSLAPILQLTPAGKPNWCFPRINKTFRLISIRLAVLFCPLKIYPSAENSIHAVYL